MRNIFLVSLLFTLSFSAFASSLPSAETAQNLLDAGRPEKAVQTLERQIEVTPTAEAYNLLCRADFELDAWDAGIPACEKAASMAPHNALYHLWLGRIYGEKAARTAFFSAAGLAKKVRAEFERAVQFAPDDWQARTDLAEFYMEAPGIVGGGKDKARAQAEMIAPLNPGIAHWVKARLAEKNHDNATAEKEYRAAIEASDGGARAWLNLAGFYRHTGRLDNMEDALHTMESRPLDSPAALVDGARLLLQTGRDNAMAIRLLRRYIASSSTVEEAPAFKAHCLLGELLEKQGDRRAAAEEYRTSIEMAGNFTAAQDGLKRVGR